MLTDHRFNGSKTAERTIKTFIQGNHMPTHNFANRIGIVGRRYIGRDILLCGSGDGFGCICHHH